MAKKLRDEDLVLNIIVNGDRGKKEIGQLERTIKDTNRELRNLEKLEQRLRAEGKKDEAQYKAVTAAIKQKNEAIVLAEARLKQLRAGLDITKLSYTELRREMSRLTRLRDMSVPGTENWKKHDAQLQLVTRRYNEVRGQAERAGFSLSKMAGKFNQYIGMITAGLATFSAAIFGIKKAITTFAEFDDKIADVMKTTGLLKEDVLDINEALKDVDTRTAQLDLLGLGRVAGKLGISAKEDVMGFIRATDQIGVALTEDLGGDIEQSINDVGKLVDIFNVGDEFGIEEGLLKVGSTINELGANSTANEGKIVDFTKRMAGIAPAAKISVANVMGLGATLDALGQSMETSGTTFTNLIPLMFGDTANFARLAKMEVGEFTDLLNNDANEALIRLLQGVKGNDESMTGLVQRMGDIGLDGARAKNIISVLANNTEALREQQALANRAFEEGTSLTEEFNIKNETAAAKLEKARKGLYNMTVQLGEKLMPVMTVSTNGFSYFVRILTVLADFLIKYGRILAVVTSAIVAYNVALYISNARLSQYLIVTKAKIALETAQRGGIILLAAAQALLTGNITRATAAMRIFNTVTKLNPVVLLISLLVAAGTAVALYTRKLSAAEKAQQALLDVQLEAQQAVSQEKVKAEQLLRIAQSKAISDDRRRKAIEELNRLSPEFLGNINMESINTDAAKRSVDKYINSLVKKARVQAANARLEAIENKRMAMELKGEGAELSTGQQLQAVFQAGWTPKFFENLASQRKDLMDQNRRAFLDELDKEQKLIEGFLDRVTDPKGVEPAGGNGSEFIEQLTEDQVKAREKFLLEAKSLIEQEKHAHQERLKEAGIFGKDRADMTADDLQVLAALEKLHGENLARIKEQQEKKDKDKEKEKMEELRQQILDGQKSLIQQEVIAHQKRMKEAGVFGKEREKLTEEDQQVLEALEKQHQANLNKIDAEAIKADIETREAAFEKKMRELRIQQNKELQVFRGTAEERERLIKQHNREQEQLQMAYMNSLLAELQAFMQSGELAGLSLSDRILSDDERKILEARIEELKFKLSELGIQMPDKPLDDPRDKRDILGFTASDWDDFFSNLDDSEDRMKAFQMAIQTIGTFWSQINELRTAGERADLQLFESNVERKKALLDSQLEKGTINQKQYNKQIKKLDAELDQKKAEYAFAQAKREKNLALFGAITNTALAVAKSLPNLILAGIVAALGGLQIATIAKTPLPEIPGAEEGGFFSVRRSQDQRMFRAKYRPDQRGYVDRPTIIAGESGREFVASNEAYNNPTIRPMLDAIDTAQRNGTISTANLTKILDRSRRPVAFNGRASGGYIEPPAASSPAVAGTTDPEMKELLRRNLQATNRLNEQLKKPIKGEWVLTGRNGFYEKDQEYKDIQDDVNL